MEIRGHRVIFQDETDIYLMWLDGSSERGNNEDGFQSS